MQKPHAPTPLLVGVVRRFSNYLAPDPNIGPLIFFFLSISLSHDFLGGSASRLLLTSNLCGAQSTRFARANQYYTGTVCEMLSSLGALTESCQFSLITAAHPLGPGIWLKLTTVKRVIQVVVYEKPAVA